MPLPEHQNAALEFPLEHSRAAITAAPRSSARAMPVQLPVSATRTIPAPLFLAAIAALVVGMTGTWIFLGRDTATASFESPRIDSGLQSTDATPAEPAAAAEFDPQPQATAAVTEVPPPAGALQAPSPLPSRVENLVATSSPAIAAPPLAAAGPGWILVKAPFVVEVFDAGRLVGSSESERIAMRAGSRQIELVSEAFDFRQTVQVSVPAGRGATVPLTVPRVAVNINAIPWAEVIIDGARVGDTPLANVLQPIGDHEIVFRHPQLGEKRHLARISTSEGQRISMDMRQP